MEKQEAGLRRPLKVKQSQRSSLEADVKLWAPKVPWHRACPTPS